MVGSFDNNLYLNSLPGKFSRVIDLDAKDVRIFCEIAFKGSGL